MKLFFSRLVITMLIVLSITLLSFIALGGLLLAGSPEFFQVLRTVVGGVLIVTGLCGVAALTVALCKR